MYPCSQGDRKQPAVVRAVAGKDVDRITIGTIYPATFGVLPLFLSKLGKRFPDVQIHVSSGSTGAIIRDLEKGRINLGFIRPVENIGSLRWQSIANERYLLAVPFGSPLEMAETVTMSDLKRARIIAFSRSNLSYTEKYFFRAVQKTRPSRSGRLQLRRYALPGFARWRRDWGRFRAGMDDRFAPPVVSPSGSGGSGFYDRHGARLEQGRPHREP
ncbi:hypothetical protein CN223_32005 [Sinorhizobium meliloti]|nr:hypothetical protein [Sinorhizobium meliloti]RVG69215.1 hypothetical protein CN223_32005 [Sinorhizobium meliloti]